MKNILDVVIGSIAHGLDSPTSDEDRRKVHIVPTSELLKINAQKYEGTVHIENNIDEQSWEIGHFLSLAAKSNPTILEVFKTLVKYSNETGKELRNLFPYIWNGKRVKDSFLGYSHDQRKRWFDDRETLERRNKYAVAHIIVLLTGIELLTYGDFSVKVKSSYIDNGLFLPWWACKEMASLGYSEFESESWNRYLFEIKVGNIQRHNRNGNIFDTAEYLKEELNKAFEKSPYKEKETDWDKVNEFILKVRKENW